MNAKNFAKRIVKARNSLSVMGEMLVQMEIDGMHYCDLIDIQDELANMNARTCPYLEAAINKAEDNRKQPTFSLRMANE